MVNQLLEQPEQTIIIHPDYSSLVFSKTRRTDSQGYFNLRKNGKYVKEHRVIWEEYNKACLLPWSHVHHKNQNRQDNTVENLEAMTKAQHMRLHLMGNKYTVGMRYHWKQDAKGRIFTEEHKKKIGDANRGKNKPIRTPEHRGLHDESLKRMYAERKANGFRWTGRKWMRV